MLPLGERPLLVRVGVHYKFSKLVVDRVEAVDSTYDVLFIGTGRPCPLVFRYLPDSACPHIDVLGPSDSGLVLKAIHLPKDHGQSQEITLEQMQVFKVH